MAKSTSTRHQSNTAIIASVFLCLLICQIVTSAPAVYDYDNLRDLYEILLRQDTPSQFVHQMERKGGRSPTLRLRFGRRSDPLWSKLSTMSNIGSDNIPDGLAEKVQYKK